MSEETPKKMGRGHVEYKPGEGEGGYKSAPTTPASGDGAEAPEGGYKPNAPAPPSGQPSNPTPVTPTGGTT